MERSNAPPGNSMVRGVVTDCFRVSIRGEPNHNARIIFAVPALAEVEVDLEKSTDYFYKVRTSAGIEGFCMKRYIALPR